MTTRAAAVLNGLPAIRPWLEDLYRHLHAHPELSMAEYATAARVVDEVRRMQPSDPAVTVDITPAIAHTGVAVVVANGRGATVLLRADMDALPVAEDTGLDYASTISARNAQGQTVPVMHACGHDMHVACLLGALRLLLQSRDAWSGTVVAVFQPAEEQYNGAQAMVADGLVARLPRPDVALGQHVLPGAAGTVMVSPGPVMAACCDFRITVHGRGGHGSAPHTALDPVVMACSLVLRLQSIVSRQVSPHDPAVLTIGRIAAGTKNNIIPASAVLDGTLRAYDDALAGRLLATIERTARAEALAWDAPEPVIELCDRLPVTDNAPAATVRVRDALVAELGEAGVRPFERQMGSEDFSELPNAWGAPYCFWSFGAFAARDWDAAVGAGTQDTDFPGNHSAHFAPLPQPTLDTGVRALVAAALAWL